MLDELVSSLLYEGYALYPYTPGATKNATPTPFGIVYPPAYAAHGASTFDHLELRCELVPDRAPAPGRGAAEVRCLGAEGERHRARPLTLAMAPAPLAELLAGPLVERHDHPGAPPVVLALSARRLDDRRGQP